MITQNGLRCDVCGNYILWDFINLFVVAGIERECHCHDACKEAVLIAGEDWKALPPGPLRLAFEEEAARREKTP